MASRQPAICPAIGLGGFDNLNSAAGVVPIIKACTVAAQAALPDAINAALATTEWPDPVATFLTTPTTAFRDFTEEVSAPAVLARLETHDFSPLHTYYRVLNGFLAWRVLVVADVAISEPYQALDWWYALQSGVVSPVGHAVEDVVSEHGWGMYDNTPVFQGRNVDVGWFSGSSVIPSFQPNVGTCVAKERGQQVSGSMAIYVHLSRSIGA